jgi:hypothetical protein
MLADSMIQPDHPPARRPPVLWVDTMFILYDTAGRYFLDDFRKYFPRPIFVIIQTVAANRGSEQ